MELLNRLRKALEDKVVVGRSNKVPKKKKHDCAGMGTFSPNAYWRILEKDDVATEEPINPTFKDARAPTIREEDAKFVAAKYNFSK